MKKEAILHIPMSEYAHGLDEKRIVLRLRAARGDLARVTLWYGDTACRRTPIDWFPEPMERTLSDEYHDWWELTLECPYHRIFYHFELSDGRETCFYYGGVFTDELVDDRSEYFKLPFNHRADIARAPDWVHGAVVYNIFPDSFATSRRHISLEPTEREFGGLRTRGKLGGTIKGVTENLDYLAELGVNCIYLNPIFAAGEYHKYDLIDYYHIDPCLGTNEDFRELVDRAHDMDMRVIIDGVFNHCGWRFFAFEDVVQRGEASRYKDWFYRLSFPVTRPEDPEEIPGYECFGYERLMPKLDTANPEVREYFCAVGEHWLREFGIDGWRLDVASEVDDAFWREFRRRVKAVKDDAILIGEVWESAGHWLAGDMFDSCMNYELRRHCRRFFAEMSEDAYTFSGRCTGMLMRYKKQLVAAQLGVLDTHDVSRFLSLCGGDLKRYRLAVLFQLCFPGVPSIFYGDELGVSGVLEEDYRRPMPWGAGDAELFEFFKKAIALRRSQPALQRGEFRVLSAERGSGLFAFAREHAGERITLALNCSEREAAFTPPGETLWSEGASGGMIGPYGFAVALSRG